MIDKGFTAFREIIKSTHVLFCKMLIQRKGWCTFYVRYTVFFYLLVFKIYFMLFSFDKAAFSCWLLASSR